jgi:hypothetical protein
LVDKRVAARNRVVNAGTIEFGESAIDRVVRNASNTGAAFD